jgi:hypothetical protein
MTRPICSLLSLAALVLSTRLGAQGMISGAKAVAGRAVTATNAHTDAEQSPSQSGSPRPSQMTPIRSSAPASKVTPSLSSKVTPAPAQTTKPTTATTTPVTTAKVTAVAAAPAAKGAKTAKLAATAPVVAPADTGARSISVTQRGNKGEVSLNREVFSYDQGGRRDPFVSLLRNGDLRPMLNDLRLVTVLYDPTGRNSIAVMRDVSTKDQYRVKVGQTLGRMRVAQIQPREIVFTIEEIGFSRQEPLALGDSSKARTQ